MAIELVKSVTLTSVSCGGLRHSSDALCRQCWKELPRFVLLLSYSCKLGTRLWSFLVVFSQFDSGLSKNFIFHVFCGGVAQEFDVVTVSWACLWKCHHWNGQKWRWTMAGASPTSTRPLSVEKTARVVWAPRGPVTSVPKSQLFAKCLKTCVIFKGIPARRSLARWLCMS